MKTRQTRKTRKGTKKSGFSLLELLAVVTILGIIAAIIVPRVSVSTTTAKEKVRDHHKGTINAAIERYYIDTGAFPVSLAVIAADTDYFPDGVPVNPVTTAAYTYNTTTNRIED